MYLTDFALDNYRSYSTQVVHFEPGICVLVGANGQGKTNFVEAIAYLSNFHSHRIGQDLALVRYQPQNQILASQSPDNSEEEFRENTTELDYSETESTASSDNAIGAKAEELVYRPGQGKLAASVVENVAHAGNSAAVIRAKAQSGSRTLLIDLEIIAGKANRARLGRAPVNPKELRGLVKTVMFAPEDLQILKGDPGMRRRFLDDLLVQAKPVQAGTIQNHTKILKQRGALLKQAMKKQRRGEKLDLELSTLSVWDAQLLKQASALIAGRNQLISDLKPYAQQAYRDILGCSEWGSSARILDLHYQSANLPLSVDLCDQQAVYHALENALEENREAEISRGVNLVGAHRDDLLISLDALPVKGFASHGETWSVALALRLGQFQMQCELGEPPILILDDVFAELDTHRRDALVAIMKQAEQVFITAAVEQDLPTNLHAQMFHVKRSAEGSEITALMTTGQESMADMQEPYVDKTVTGLR